MTDDNHLLMVELAGPRPGQPTNDLATTMPFERQVDTVHVLRVAPIDDETVPYSPVELETFQIQPPVTPVALDARINLVAIDHTPTRAPAPPRSRGVEVAIAALFLLGALAIGLGLPFVIAAIVR